MKNLRSAGGTVRYSIAGAGFAEESDWIQWLESQLNEVAHLLPAGDNIREFLFYIRELKKV